MSYTTLQDVLDFVEDNNVKFVRFAFCDIFGVQKNIAVLASDLPRALEEGVSFVLSPDSCMWRRATLCCGRIWAPSPFCPGGPPRGG